MIMQKNNNLSPLPFFTDIQEQHHRKSYAYGNVYPLYCPMGSVPPFQIVKGDDEATVASVTLVSYPDGTKTDITTAISSAGLTINRYPAYGYDIVIYPSRAPMNLTQYEGQYYLVLTMSDGAVFYSDIFTVVGDMSGFLQVQWWDLEDLVMDECRIAYNPRYRNTLWLQTQLGKPEYEFQEEGEQRDGYFFPEKMISEKKYRCVILAPEYLCDVMRFISLSDFVMIRDQFGHEYHCDTFLCTPEWQQQGDLASVEIEFTCDTVAKKIGKHYGRGVDFNDDFNNDFDIEDINN